MLTRAAFVVIALLAQACSSGPSASVPDEFRLCGDDPAHPSVISINYPEMRGYFEDYSEPVRKCGQTAAACIDFPLLLSAPPRLPTTVSDVVQWSGGDHQFLLRQLPAAEDAYFIEAVNFQSGPAGSTKRFSRGFYTYTKDMGLMTFRTEGDTSHGWVRCGGRLTFEDLRALTNRLP